MTWNISMSLVPATTTNANAQSGAMTVAAAVAALINGTVNSPLAGSLSLTGYPPGNPIFGINFDAGGGAFLAGAGFPIFQDRVREARGFTTTTTPWSASVSMDSSGWPTQDFLCLLGEGNSTPSWATSGAFKCGFTGTGTVASFGGCSISNTVTSGGRTTFDLTCSGYPHGFTVTGTSGGVTNVFAYLPGYGTSTIDGGSRYTYSSASLFTTEAIAHYSKYGWIRWMDWSNARFNTATMTSSNRNTASNQKTNKAGATSNTGDGYNTQWAVDACNAFGIGCYYTVALNYDTTYLPAVATDLANLTPGRTVYVEPGNELWNFGGGIGGTTYNNVVNAYNTAHSGVLNYDSTSDQLTLNARYLAVWVHDISVAMQSAFGARYGTDCKVVAMWQTGTIGLSALSIFLQFLIHQYGSVSPFVHCIGVAPYMWRANQNVPGDGVDHTGVNDTVANIQSQITANATWLPYYDDLENIAILAMKNGLQMMTYEGGQEVGGDLSVTNMGAAIQDSGMVTIVSNYLQNVYSSGTNLFTWLASGIDLSNSVSSPRYNLATTFPISTANSTRWSGFSNALAGSITYNRNVVSGSGSSFNGKNCADYGWNGSSLQFRLTNPTLAGSGGNFAPYFTGGYVPYIVNCTAPGTYTFVVNFTNSGSSVSTSAESNGTINSGFTIPSGTNNVTLGSVTLARGRNYVVLGNGVNQGGVTVNTLTFN